MDQDVQYLLDRARISDVVLRFFLSLDRFDDATVGECITDPFTLDAGIGEAKPQPIPEFLTELAERNWGFVGSLHINSGHLISIDGDEAHVSAHMWAAHVAGEPHEDQFVGYGFYEIDLVRDGEGWLMRELKIVPVRAEGGAPPHVYGLAAKRWAAGEGHPRTTS